ncbi:MAG: amidohydrolase family protein [Spirochaetales bacterium]|uniref:Amidohydrolase family protein n=1 Tax=Candidatus Thalassospirochaeta sargassi TaxID=3119039 RepID=A0AAJ1IFA7_9SPIO|nr:amidohydrolase family protein [Spirochaetales bacterium]
MITDIHIHFCAADRFDELLQFCAEAGINRAGLVSLPDKKNGNFNSAVQKAFKSAPEKFIGFGCLDHRRERTEKNGAMQVEELYNEGFKGLKLLLGKPAAEDEFKLEMESSYIAGALKAAANLNMPVLFHIADPPDHFPKQPPGTFSRWIERGVELFSNFPETTFITAHLLFLAGGLSNLSRIMETLPNLYLDTAPGRWFYRPLSENKDAATNFFNCYADRLLLGSDSIFVSPDITTYPMLGIEENNRTIRRINRFLSAGEHEIIDDPYPGNGGGWLACLNLDKAVIKKITRTNADRFFKDA